MSIFKSGIQGYACDVCDVCNHHSKILEHHRIITGVVTGPHTHHHPPDRTHTQTHTRNVCDPFVTLWRTKKVALSALGENLLRKVVKKVDNAKITTYATI